MSSHNRLSPGIEFNEHDRSQYGRENFAITNTAVMMTGFASKGEDYSVQWVNSMPTFKELYGEPSNEPERYLYNSAYEVLNRGGVCLVAKLPYDNKSLDSYIESTYRLSKTIELSAMQYYAGQLSSVDNSMTRFGEIRSVGTGMISMDRLDDYKVENNSRLADGEIKIVDMTRNQCGRVTVKQYTSFYDETTEETVTSCQVSSYQCLGIVPVFTGALNAMFYQGVIQSNSVSSGSKYGETYDLSAFQPAVTVRTRNDTSISVDFCTFDPFSFDIPISANSLNTQCVSKQAVQLFPNIMQVADRQLDKTYTQYVGLVVFVAYSDPANDSKISFQPVESFVGSLNKLAKDRFGATAYIGNIVNSSSNYVNLFSNVKTDTAFTDMDAVVVRNQPFYVHGFLEHERVKHIDYVRSIVDPLTRILDSAQDPNQVRIDVVADCGITNIAQYVSDPAVGQADASTAPGVYSMYNADVYPAVQGTGVDSWKLLSRPAAWQAVAKKFDDFCKYTRRDCMFVLDGPRTLVLERDEKRVRRTKIGSSIENTVCADLKYIAGMNSSYTAGYVNWFLVRDTYSGDLFWMPPSAKAVGVYVNTDAYFHKWNAPAGIVRGVVSDALDLSFDPRNDEAGKIYQQAWNYAVNYPIDGIILEGQKTMQIQQTALDRVNVRRLMIYLEKTVVQLARRFLYEGNTEFLRQRFVDTLVPLFEDAKNGDGVLEYAIKCDDVLNTPDVIDRNELRCKIGVKPVKCIEWIVLDFIVTSQSASVSEEVAS